MDHNTLVWIQSTLSGLLTWSSIEDDRFTMDGLYTSGHWLMVRIVNGSMLLEFPQLDFNYLLPHKCIENLTFTFVDSSKTKFVRTSSWCNGRFKTSNCTQLTVVRKHVLKKKKKKIMGSFAIYTKMLRVMSSKSLRTHRFFFALCIIVLQYWILFLLKTNLKFWILFSWVNHLGSPLTILVIKLLVFYLFQILNWSLNNKKVSKFEILIYFYRYIHHISTWMMPKSLFPKKDFNNNAEDLNTGNLKSVTRPESSVR